MMSRKVKQSRLSTEAEALCIVAGRDEEVCEDGQLVLGERLLVLRPVVLVGSLEVLQKNIVQLLIVQHDIAHLEDFFDGGRYGDGVMEMIC